MLKYKILILIYCWLSVAGVSVSSPFVYDKYILYKYVVFLGTHTEAPTQVRWIMNHNLEAQPATVKMPTRQILILICCRLSVAGVSVSIVCDKYVVCLGTRTEAPTLVSGGVDPEPQSAASNTQNVNTPSSSNTNQEF